ncbi:suppressor of fused domain protein [Brachybacterium sp. UNK5269]|uniref:suppressor of fused domain protein n=1 Tax=Brachybacterium sp. UNK5269 TaxID=3408576 RepID=UPI003BAEC7B5
MPSSPLPPPREETQRSALLRHLSGVLGEDHIVASATADGGIPLELAVFAASAQIPHPTLVTLGMSEHPMRTADGEEFRLELLIGLPAGWPGIDPPDPALLAQEANSWPLRLLQDTARIPSTYDSVLDWGHSITNAGERYAASVPFTGALIGPPYGYPPRIMNAATPAGAVQILAVLPVTDEELALRVSVPSGGDLVLDRLARAGVTAVIDPSRDAVTAGPAPWRVHVLLRERAEHLGQVLSGVLPNLAEQLGAQGIDELVLPLGEEPLRWRVGGRFAPSALAADLARTELAEHAALATAIDRHRTVLTLSPERPGDGATVTGAAAMTAMLLEAGKAVAVWLPHQGHLTLPERFLADLEEGRPLTCRVHPEPLADGCPAVLTQGLAALGGTEVLLRQEGATVPELTARLEAMLTEGGGIGAVPVSGQRHGDRVLRAGTHPDRGTALLELVAG